MIKVPENLKVGEIDDIYNFKFNIGDKVVTENLVTYFDVFYKGGEILTISKRKFINGRKYYWFEEDKIHSLLEDYLFLYEDKKEK